MNKLARNEKTAIAFAALALLLGAASLHGCGFEGSWVQINEGTATSSKTLSLALHGEDGDQVRAYIIAETTGSAETPAAPAAAASGWVNIPPAQQATVYDATVDYNLDIVAPATDPSAGRKTIYVWFKDGYGNVSDPVSDTITYGSTGGGQVCTTPGYCN